MTLELELVGYVRITLSISAVAVWQVWRKTATGELIEKTDYMSPSQAMDWQLEQKRGLCRNEATYS